MIETTQTALIDRPIEDVWAFARDIGGWAQLMPGLQDCDVIDENNSRWVLKVGAGGMVRTVAVLVKVDEWDGPERVFFSYRLDKDPVEGGGIYAARAVSPERTEVSLHVRVIGSGAMAPMWEAVGKPLLPKLAKGFANQFKQKIEADNPRPPSVNAAPIESPPRPHKSAGSLTDRLLVWFRSLFSGSKRNSR